MAMINIPTDHIKLRKTLSIEQKPLMLKDYLRDDLNSCSSSGFKSFPRRQCCTTVRFLLEADLKKTKDYSSITKRLLKRSRSKPASTNISTLQRASQAVLNAVKLLPFASFKSSSPSLQSNNSRKGLLPRSFSRKLFKRRFWRKAEKEDGEIRRWRLFREFLEEKDQSSDQNNIANVNTTDTSSIIITTTRVSTSTSSNSNSWPESEFLADILQSSSGNSESLRENDVVDGKTDLPGNKRVSNVTGITVGEHSINCTKGQDWRNEDGKEQSSPVSVLDCPFDDEEDDSSPFKDQLARVEGTKQKLMQKIRRFENLAQLTSVDLEKRIALSELEDESLESTKEPCLVSVDNNGNISDEVKQEKDKEGNGKLLMLLKAKIPSDSSKFKADNLLLDFFRERMVEDNNAKKHAKMGLEEFALDLLKVAEAWVNGNPQELLLGWEVQDGRKAYVKEMERNENWRNFYVEKEKVGSEVELEIFSLLVDELLTDLF
ncbi:uncharacterized protein LOC110428082 [Herrania umbratica]|uniref:Uncharacterized protein LOC110428082 n=1 Tax=Herrania umbratica TaxID=108875 RepID=A0A6J1BJZ1_9ROSI|nr:uncharacterized protein LOC110428082 [Herrania umbratica]